jgi:ATP-dependent RNA helicase DDX49/DBP8
LAQTGAGTPPLRGQLFLPQNLEDFHETFRQTNKFQHATMAPSRSPDPVPDDSHESSDASDVEQTELQTRAPKRRRLSESSVDSYVAPAPLPTLSRIKKKGAKDDKLSTSPDNDNPVLIRDALEIGLQDEESSFKALSVAPWLVGSLTTMAVRKPTAIQKACIPEILKGRDCIGGSRTGSGKTIAFAVPMLQKWAQDPFGIFALVLTPTRYVAGRFNNF